MTQNIVKAKDRNWIKETYGRGPQKKLQKCHKKLQDWVTKHPEAKTVTQLAHGIEETINAMAPGEKLKVSRHLTGNAFDIVPPKENAVKIIAEIRKLPGFKLFLPKEGKLIIWHVQF